MDKVKEGTVTVKSLEQNDFLALGGIISGLTILRSECGVRDGETDGL